MSRHSLAGSRHVLSGAAVVLSFVALPALAGAQQPPAARFAAAPVLASPGSGASAAPARVAVLDLLFVGELANAIQPTDSLVAPAASRHLRSRFAAAPGIALVDSAQLAAALRAPAVIAAAGGKPCAAVLACQAALAEATGATWVAAGRLTKISSLVWVFTAQLMERSTGRLAMNDEYEVKGAAGEMSELGARVFARRAVKTMTDAGIP